MDIGVDVLGRDSMLDKLLQRNVKIITFGNPYLRYTFVHFLETIANVPYRFDKNFSGIIRDTFGKESAKMLSTACAISTKKASLTIKKWHIF